MRPTDPGVGQRLFLPVSRRSATLWNAVFLYGEMASLLIRTLLLVPLYLRYVTLAEYGAWLATGGLLAYLASIDLGLTSVLPQQLAVAHGARDLDRLRGLLGTGLAVCFAIALGIGAIGAALSPLLPATLQLDPAAQRLLTSCLLIASLALGLNLLGQSLAALLRAMQRPMVPGTAAMGADVVSIVLTVLLLQSGAGLRALAWGLVARGACMLVVNSVGLTLAVGGWKALGPRWSWREARVLWLLSLYQFASRMAAQLSTVADPYLIGLLLGPQATATYVLTTRAIDMCRLLASRLGDASGPALAHLGGESVPAAVRGHVAVLLRGMVLVGGTLTLGALALDEPFVSLWVGSQSFAGHAVTALFAAWALGSVLQSGLYNTVFALGEIPALWRSSRLEVVIRLPLLVVLVGLFGPWGAPAAALAGIVAANAVLLAALRRHLGIAAADLRRNARRLARDLAALASVAALCLALVPPRLSWPGFLLAGALYTVAAGLVLYLLERDLVRTVAFRRRAAAA